MKKTRWIVVGSVVVAGLLVWSCASTNPNAGQPDPVTGQPQPKYLPNKTATQAASTAKDVGAVLPAPWGDLLALAGGVTTIIAGYIANKKNSALSQLAASVAAQPATVSQAIVDHASNTPQATAVFDAVNTALPPDNVVAGSPKA